MNFRKTILNKLLIILFLAGCFVGFLLLTDPNKVALPLLMVPFALLGVIFYQTLLLVSLLARRQKSSYLGKIIALSVATLGVGLLLLQSLNQLTWRDGLLAVLFAGLFWLYIWRADFLRSFK